MHIARWKKPIKKLHTVGSQLYDILESQNHGDSKKKRIRITREQGEMNRWLIEDFQASETMPYDIIMVNTYYYKFF